MKKHTQGQVKIVDVLIIGSGTHARALEQGFEAEGKKVLSVPDENVSSVRCLGPRVYSVGGKRYEVRSVFVTTYGEPQPTPLEGLLKTPHFSNVSELLAQVKKPSSVIVCCSDGGSLKEVFDLIDAGWEVDVISKEARPLQDFDASVSDYMKRVLKVAKVRFFESTTPLSTIKTPRGIFVIAEQYGVPKRVKADCLIVQPTRNDVVDLGFVNAGQSSIHTGIEHKDLAFAVHGNITYLRPDMFVTLDDVQVLVRNTITRNVPKKKIHPVVAHMFEAADLSYVTVGSTEHELSVTHIPFSKALVVTKDPLTGKQNGFIKLICKYNGQLLGVSCVHRSATDFVAVWSRAIRKRQKAQSILSILTPGSQIAESYLEALAEI